MKYRGARKQRVWNIAESSVRFVMKTIYNKDNVPKLNGNHIVIDNLKRNELCQVLENTVFEKMKNYNNSIKSSKDNDTTQNTSLTSTHTESKNVCYFLLLVFLKQFCILKRRFLQQE